MRIRQKVDFTFGLPENVEIIGKIPTVSRRMALVIYYQRLLERKVVTSLMDIARLEKISPNRVSSIMKLSLLSPHIQEKIVSLPREHPNSKRISTSQCVEIAKEIDFEKQMVMFEKLV
jgi:hypothetical protein